MVFSGFFFFINVISRIPPVGKRPPPCNQRRVEINPICKADGYNATVTIHVPFITMDLMASN